MAERAKFPTAAAGAKPEPVEKIVSPFVRFAQMESSSGIVLLVATAAALLWVNLGGADAYHHLFHELKLTFGFGDFALSKSLEHWINDGLMAFFFLLVGLEIKREILLGELNSVKKAALPIAGALGGMVVPALIYTAVNLGGGKPEGWGVPMATDIAFALGIMALLGRRVPLALRVFLTSLAIVDDLGALIVIALFYTEDLAGNYLVYCGIVITLFALANALGVRWTIVYGVLTLALWYFVLESGVHATIAGVVAAMFIPARSRVDGAAFLETGRNALSVVEEEPEIRNLARSRGRTRAAVIALEASCRQVVPPLHRMELDLVPWVAFLIVPVFAFANAGVTFADGAAQLATGTVSTGIALGLLLGKPIGIFGFSFVAVKLGLASLPSGVGWRHILGAGLLGGIGFTMALFIANLAFTGDDLSAAKIGILGASAIAAVAGLIVLAGVKPPPEHGHD